MKKIWHKKHSSLKFNYYKKYKDIKETIEKRYNIFITVITFVILILFINLFYIQVINQDNYKASLQQLTEKIVEGSTAPRGRIYDRNHKLIVDNKPTKVIYYKKKSGITTKEEIELAYKVANLITVDFTKLTDTNLKNFWIKQNPKEALKKITDTEYQELEERKITSSDIEKLKLERITEEEIMNYNDLDKEAAYIYTLMNKGYSYSEKIIKKDDVTDAEYAIVSASSNKLNGIDTRLDWDRSYPYDNTLRSILGSVSTSEKGIPYDLKNYYLEKGYSLDDRVGTSYLEYFYDDYLKGTKNTYKVLQTGEKVLVSSGTRGSDIVLTIDIELQKAVEEILEQELIKTKGEANTEYYNRSFVIITDPKTGEILAMAGKQIIMKDSGYQIYDYTPGTINSSVVVGSVVKGASHIVGYNTGALKIGETRTDTCVKIASTPIKCSWKYLGVLDDLTALKYSSNTYQFYTAMKVAKVEYTYNGGLKVDQSAFDTYRNTFNQFGLGVKTGIDLPNESSGLKGKNDTSGLLLDFSIGQYDNYTPMQLSQYITTIANGGNRLEPHLLKQVYSSKVKSLTKKIKEVKQIVLNTVDTKEEYLKRVKEGFKQVLSAGGTGYGYIDQSHNPAGKTGTSQSFVDSNNDGKVDTETVTTTFVGYAPYDDPKVTFTVVSPDVYQYGNGSTYQSSVNKRITKAVSDKYFELYD